MFGFVRVEDFNDLRQRVRVLEEQAALDRVTIKVLTEARQLRVGDAKPWNYRFENGQYVDSRPWIPIEHAVLRLMSDLDLELRHQAERTFIAEKDQK